MPETETEKSIKNFYKIFKELDIRLSIDTTIEQDSNSIAKYLSATMNDSLFKELGSKDKDRSYRLDLSENIGSFCKKLFEEKLEKDTIKGIYKRLIENLKEALEMENQAREISGKRQMAELREFVKDFHVYFEGTKMVIPMSNIEMKSTKTSALLKLENVELIIKPKQIPSLFARGRKIGAGVSSAFHPHVNHNGAVCQGDAIIPIELAFIRRDFISIVDLMESVLNTYNPSSAYHSLESLSNLRMCSLCEDYLPDLQLHICKLCRTEVCNTCSLEIDLDSTGRSQYVCQLCEGHLKKCVGCSENTLNKGCSACGEIYCSNCLVEDSFYNEKICHSCNETSYKKILQEIKEFEEKRDKEIKEFKKAISEQKNKEAENDEEEEEQARTRDINKFLETYSDDIREIRE